MKTLKVGLRLIMMLCLILVSSSFGTSASQNDSSLIAAALDDYLASKDSPMVDEGAHYLKWGKYFNIDPRLVIAISGAESTFGKNPCGNEFNVWGWMLKGECWAGFEPGLDADTNQERFENAPGFVPDTGITMETGYEDGIFWVTENLWRSYLNQGLNTVEKIGSTWCQEGCEHWTPNVEQFLKEMGGDPNHLVFPRKNLPVVDDDPTDNLTWHVPSNYFGNYYEAMGGYHSGEDWNLVGGDPNADFGKPVYAIADGTVEKVSDLGDLGFLVVLKHTGTFTIPGKSATEHGQSYSYSTEVVNSIYSVYMHIDNVTVNEDEGEHVEQGTVLGNIMNPDGGPHLHFEIRHPDAKNSNNWSMVGDKSNWSPQFYYLNLQKMVNAGVRDPREFIAANSFEASEEPKVTADVALIIDSSGSMEENDPGDLRKEAAKHFIDLAFADKTMQIAVVDFDDYVRTRAPLTLVDTPENRTALHNAVNRVDSDGGTDLGLGLRQSYNELLASKFPDVKKAGVMLTDGQGDYSGQADWYAAKGWSVYTIGLGSDVDRNLLEQIATSTPDGQYFQVSLDNMLTVYDKIRARTANESILSTLIGFINEGQEIIKIIIIDPSVTDIKIGINWQGSEMTLILIAPDGRIITPQDAATDPNIDYHKSDNYAFYTINSPMPGEWQVKLIGTDIPPEGEQYNLVVTADSNFMTNLLPFEPSYSIGDIIRIGVDIKEETDPDNFVSVTGATATAEIVRPDGQVDTLTLFDDGTHDDDAINDGVYANNYQNVDKEGQYFIKVSCQNGFEREVQETVMVGPIDTLYIDGSSLTPAAGSAIDETTPTISALISGQAGNIKADTIKLTLDDNTLAHSYDPVNQVVSYTPTAPLPNGKHTVGLSVENTVGDLVISAWNFSIGEVTEGFSLQLEAGLNMISLPLKPDTPYTARSFADFIGATVVIKLDEKQHKFVGFTTNDPTNGFPIEGGRGYIVNITEGKTVTFTGTAWRNAPAVKSAPREETGIWAFVLSGMLERDDWELNNNLTVQVKNLRTGAVTRDVVFPSGYLAVASADLSRKSIIQAGDKLEISFTTEEIEYGKIIREVNTHDIRKAFLSVRLPLSSLMPSENALFQNFPNPFNPDTWLPYQLANDSPVAILIYNQKGQLVRTIALSNRKSGIYTTKDKAAYWDGKDSLGEKVASGIYFYTLKVGPVSVGTIPRIGAGEFRATRKMVIVK